MPNERVALLGQSIGCAIAIEMAIRGFGSRLILVSPFSSLLDMAVALYPVVRPAARIAPFLLLDKFENVGKVARVYIPALVVHGTDDEIIPFQQGREVAERFPDAVLWPIQGGRHNDLLFGTHQAAVLCKIIPFALQ